jgi:hypothetical protein
MLDRNRRRLESADMHRIATFMQQQRTRHAGVRAIPCPGLTS